MNTRSRQQQYLSTSALPIRHFALAPAVVSGGLPATTDPAGLPAQPADNAAAPAGEPSVRDIMEFDFFADLAPAGRTPAAPTIRAPDPRTPAAGTPPAAATPAAPAAAPKPLAVQNQEQLAALLQRMSVQLATPPAAQPVATAQPPAGPPKPIFSNAVPLEVIRMLRDDDDKVLQQGIEIVYNAAMNNSVEFVVKLLQSTVLPNLAASWRNEFAVYYENRKRSDAFYGAFPELDSDVGRAMVAKVSDNVAAYLKQTTGADPDRGSIEFLNKVGVVSRTYIRQLAGVPADAAPAPAAPTNVAPSQTTPAAVPSNGNGEHPRFDPAFVAPRGARPSEAAAPNAEQAEIAEMGEAFGVKFN